MEVLGMQLEVVRIVLENDVNEISVCADLKRRSGVFYTLVSIRDRGLRGEIAGLIAAGGLFAGNRDFMGSFSRADTFNLLFLYRTENLLSHQEILYATDFASRKQIATGVLVALAETQANGPAAALLLHERNINIAPDKSLYFNYFIDFAQWDSSVNQAASYSRAAQAAFDIMAHDYEIRHHGNVVDYPSELQVFYRKIQLKAFSSCNAVITHIRTIPDKPAEQRRGVFRLSGAALSAAGWAKRHSLALFLMALVLLTAAFAGYQIITRLSYRSAAQKNTSYAGLEYIGEVSLGDETL